jgi:hypothetical protein
MANIEDTRRALTKDLESKWGFVIYRTTYKDDAEWKRFMDHINTRIRLNLEEDGAGDLFSRLDWCVQEDPALENARVNQVRK